MKTFSIPADPKYINLFTVSLKTAFVFQTIWRRIKERLVRIMICEEVVLAYFVVLSEELSWKD